MNRRNLPLCQWLCALAILCIAVLDAVPPAWAALDQAALHRIVSVARELGPLAVRPGPVAADPRDPTASPEAIERAFAGAVMADVVVNVLQRDPGGHAEAVAAAVAAAPALAEPIVARVSRAFPQHREAIAEAAATAQVALATPAQPAQPAPMQPLAQPEPQPGPGDSAGGEPGGDFAAIEAALYEEEGAGADELSDPIEGLNRFVFAINEFIDTIALRPLAALYGFVAPQEVKSAMRHFFANLNEPVVFANKLLQLEGDAALNTLGRFAVNSTVGGAGFFEVAEGWGMAPEYADFGQTLYTWGVGPGPYVVLPLIGPNSSRHAAGRGVDTLLHPRTWILPTEANLALTGVNALVIREQLLEPLAQIKLGALDYYTALKSVYWQNRQRTIRGEQGGYEFSVSENRSSLPAPAAGTGLDSFE